MADPLPDGLSAPARRALDAAGISSLDDVASTREVVLADLHGVGPRAVAALRAALARTGRTFAPQPDDDEDVLAIDAWLDGLDDAHRSSLSTLRTALRSVLPHAEEGWSYGMPAALLQGAAVAGYGSAAGHCVYAPMSGSVLDRLAAHLEGRDTSRGTLRFPPGTVLPAGLVRRLVAARLAELSDVTSGHRREYHRDGRVKAEGSMRDGLLEGPWYWYRADGTLLRTGSFRRGEKTGTWTTYDRDGTALA